MDCNSKRYNNNSNIQVNLHPVYYLSFTTTITTFRAVESLILVPQVLYFSQVV